MHMMFLIAKNRVVGGRQAEAVSRHKLRLNHSCLSGEADVTGRHVARFCKGLTDAPVQQTTDPDQAPNGVSFSVSTYLYMLYTYYITSCQQHKSWGTRLVHKHAAFLPGLPFSYSSHGASSPRPRHGWAEPSLTRCHTNNLRRKGWNPLQRPSVY